MSARATPRDVSVLEIGGVDYRGLATQASVAINHQTADSRPISRKYANPQAVKSSWVLNMTSNIVKSGAATVTNLDLTGTSILGTAYVADVESLQFNVACAHVPGDACQDGWAYPVYDSSDITGTATLKVPTGSVQIMAGQDAPGDADGVFTFTLNGNTVTLPVILTSIDHSMVNGSVQTVTVSFQGQDPRTGNMPTAPTGTTTIVEKILNAPETALAVEVESKAVGGVNYTGNVLISAYGLSINNGAVVSETFTWTGVGAPTTAATV